MASGCQTCPATGFHSHTCNTNIVDIVWNGYVVIKDEALVQFRFYGHMLCSMDTCCVACSLLILLLLVSPQSCLPIFSLHRSLVSSASNLGTTRIIYIIYIYTYIYIHIYIYTYIYTHDIHMLYKGFSFIGLA